VNSHQKKIAMELARGSFTVICGCTVSDKPRKAKELVAEAREFQTREVERMGHDMWWPTTEPDQIVVAHAAHEARMAADQIGKAARRVLQPLNWPWSCAYT